MNKKSPDWVELERPVMRPEHLGVSICDDSVPMGLISRLDRSKLPAILRDVPAEALVRAAIERDTAGLRDALEPKMAAAKAKWVALVAVTSVMISTAVTLGMVNLNLLHWPWAAWTAEWLAWPFAFVASILATSLIDSMKSPELMLVRDRGDDPERVVSLLNTNKYVADAIEVTMIHRHLWPTAYLAHVTAKEIVDSRAWAEGLVDVSNLGFDPTDALAQVGRDAMAYTQLSRELSEAGVWDETAELREFKCKIEADAKSLERAATEVHRIDESIRKWEQAGKMPELTRRVQQARAASPAIEVSEQLGQTVKAVTHGFEV